MATLDINFAARRAPRPIIRPIVLILLSNCLNCDSMYDMPDCCGRRLPLCELKPALLSLRATPRALFGVWCQLIGDSSLRCVAMVNHSKAVQLICEQVSNRQPRFCHLRSCRWIIAPQVFVALWEASAENRGTMKSGNGWLLGICTLLVVLVVIFPVV